MIIPDGPFQGKEAILTTSCDCVLIKGEAEFWVKDGKIVSEIDYDQRDLQHVYDLLREREQA
jgi:endo-beta-N-acetylglucosaminidase D